MKSNQWFSVSKEGLGRQAEEQGMGRLVGELIQNALDEPGVTQIAVTLSMVPGQEMADLTVSVDEADNAGLRAADDLGRRRLALAQVEALKEKLPRFIHGRRVGPPAVIVGFNQVEVPARGEGCGYHGINASRSASMSSSSRAHRHIGVSIPQTHRMLTGLAR